MNTNIITICVFALLGFIAPLLGLKIDMTEEGTQLNKVEALVIGLPVALIAGLTAWYGNIWVVVAILILLAVLQPLPLFERDRSMMYLMTSIVFAALLITLIVQQWTGANYYLIIYVVAISAPIAIALFRNIADNAAMRGEDLDEEEVGWKTPALALVAVAALITFLLVYVNTGTGLTGPQLAEEPIPTVEAAEVTTTEAAELDATPEVQEEATAVEVQEEPEEINLSGKREGASISTVSQDEVEAALTVDLNKIALFGNRYEKYSRIFSDFGEECMPTQANWDRKHEDLKYALDKKFIKNTWQDAPCFMPVYVKDALTADGVKGLDTLAKFLNEHHKEDMKEDVIKQIKCNPVYGMMWADGMSQLELTTGKTLGDLNEWMTRAIDRNEEFRQVPYGQHPRGNEGWLEAYIDEAGNKKIRTTDEYDEFATKMLILIFDCFSDELGIDRYQSKIMYGLEPNMDGDLIQCERLEKGEDYPGLMLKYDRKDADREILLKVNIWDLRLEICDRKQKSVAQIQAEKPKKKVTPKPVAPVQVAPITPVTVNPVTGVPVWSTPSGGGGGDHPDHPDNPNPPSTPEKDPSQDPGPRGNAPDGSGPNDDPGPGAYQPDEPKWEAPKVTEPEHHEEHHDEPKQEDHHDEEEKHVDENKPDDKPTETHNDSHDEGGSNHDGSHDSGDHNGSFSMPD